MALVCHTDLVALEHLLSLDSIPDPSIFFRMQQKLTVREEPQGVPGGSLPSTFPHKQPVLGEGRRSSSFPHVSQQTPGVQ